MCMDVVVRERSESAGIDSALANDIRPHGKAPLDGNMVHSNPDRHPLSTTSSTTLQATLMLDSTLC